jgi:hypothetical protein
MQSKYLLVTGRHLQLAVCREAHPACLLPKPICIQAQPEGQSRKTDILGTARDTLATLGRDIVKRAGQQTHLVRRIVPGLTGTCTTTVCARR